MLLSKLPQLALALALTLVGAALLDSPAHANLKFRQLLVAKKVVKRTNTHNLAMRGLDHKTCAKDLDQHIDVAEKRIIAGTAATTISATEKKELDEHLGKLKAEKDKLAKGGFSPEECATLFQDISEFNVDLTMAMCSVDGKLDNKKDEEARKACITELKEEHRVFNLSYTNAKKAKLISAAEMAKIEASRKTVAVLEKKVTGDGKVNWVELKTVVEALKIQNDLLETSISRAPASK